MSMVWLLEALLLGAALAARFGGVEEWEPRWARLLLLAGGGAAVGIGVASCLYFILGGLLGVPVAAMAVELAALLGLSFDLFRRKTPLLRTVDTPKAPLFFWLAVTGLAAAVAAAVASMVAEWDANPQGGWDAWAIWNLRARFLASGAPLAARAWAHIPSGITHPEYPLLLPSFAGRCWAFGHSLANAVPETASLAFFLAIVAITGGTVAVLRGWTLGILAALAIAATPALWREAPSQYSDVPVACYFLGAVAFALLDRPLLAGLLAGCAAWTKDEGLLFLVLWFVAMAVWKRRSILMAALGALPGAAVTLYFKMALAPTAASHFAGAIHRVADLSRYLTVAGAFLREFWALGAGWYHPILAVAVLALVVRFDRVRRRDAIFAGSILAALASGYAGVYLLSSYDLVWHMQTSLARLMVQLWPLAILTIFLTLRAPEATAIKIPGKRKR